MQCEFLVSYFGMAKLGPQGSAHLHHLSILELLLVWPVGHMDPHIADCVTKPSQMPWSGNLPIWMWRINLHSHLYYSLMWLRMGENFEELAKEGGEFILKWKGHLNVVSQNLEPASIFFSTFSFWFETQFIQTKQKYYDDLQNSKIVIIT